MNSYLSLIGFQNPPGVRGRVSGGMGMGWDFHTLRTPLSWAGVKGIYKDKNICIYRIYLPLKKIFLSKNLVCGL